MDNIISKQKLELICGSAFFAGVDEIVVERIVTDNRCILREIPKGMRPAGEDGLGILLDGQLHLEKGVPGGKAVKLSTLRPGTCFSLSASAAQGGVWMTAAKNAEVLLLPEPVLRWAMQRNFTITENYIRFLTDQIQILYEKLSDLTGGTAKQRLAVFLDANSDTDGCIQTTMTDLSRQLNVGRATVYRALGALEAQGIVRVGGKTVQVLDRQALRRPINSDAI